MEAKVISMKTYTPEIIIKSDDSKGFRKYLSQGYFVFDKKNGYWILRKNTKIMVTIEYEGTRFTINLRSAFRRYYGEKVEQKWIELFQSDLEANKVMLKEGSNGNFSIVEK